MMNRKNVLINYKNILANKTLNRLKIKRLDELEKLFEDELTYLNFKYDYLIDLIIESKNIKELFKINLEEDIFVCDGN